MNKKILENFNDIVDQKNKCLIRNWEIWIQFSLVGKNNYFSCIEWYSTPGDKTRTMHYCYFAPTVEKSFKKLELSLLRYCHEYYNW